jgi:hypothetical protein
MGKYIIASVAAAALSFTPMVAFADSVSVNFEPSTYVVGNIDGQNGWTKTGPYDANVAATGGVPGSFGLQSLKISDAVTSGSFGDQTFSPSLANEAGETDALNGTLSGGVRQPHFEAQFDLASAIPGAEQPGLTLSVSPDRGDGARMSYLRFEDSADGLNVFFYDVQGQSNPANFMQTQIASGLSRSPHTFKFAMDFVDGPSNDVVKVYIDGVLVHTGTSWENYYRFDPESNPSLVSNSRTVDSLLFREGGASHPANSGNGFLIDNLSLASGPVPDTTAPAVPVHVSPADGTVTTTAGLTMIDWTDVSDPSGPVVYYYQSSLSPSLNGDGSFTSPAYTSGALSSSEISTLGTPEGTYYWHVRAADNVGNSSAWSNAWTVIVDNTPPPVVITPTNKDQCKNDGWKTFANPSFKNQGQCVSYVVSQNPNK